MSRRTASEEERTLFRKTVAQSRPRAAETVARPRPQAGIGARLDLHGFTQAAAHCTLLSFLQSARAEGARRVLVVTGKGDPGVLRTMVPRWLNEAPFAALIRGWNPAPRRLGGDGALCVQLKKP